MLMAMARNTWMKPLTVKELIESEEPDHDEDQGER